MVQKIVWYLQGCVGSLKGHIEEEWFMGVMAPQDLLRSGWTEGTLEDVFFFFLIYLTGNINLFN